jgi:hypothetical protein
MDKGLILKEGTREQLLEDGPPKLVYMKKTLDDLFIELTGRKIDE